jgi:hypothetical protein
MDMSSADLVRAQYSGEDFQTHLDDLRARIQVSYGSVYNDFAASSLGMMLLDSTAFGLDTLSFYLSRRATDSYLSTARTRKSISRLTRQLGYKMGPAVSSTVDLTVAIPVTGFDVTIPRGFKFLGPNQLVFECAEAVTWRSTETGAARTKNVSCYEGVTTTETFTADSAGAPNQIFQLKRVPSASYIVLGSVLLSVDGAPFYESEFLTFDATNQFEVGYNDDPPTVRFGDGVAGNVPAPGATISVTYVASRGKDGLVTAHTITKAQTPLVVAFQTITMTVDNSLGSVGGDDPETLAHAKIYAPQVYKSRYVAVTRPDYEALAGSFADPLFGRVAAAQAVSSRSAASDAELNTAIENITGAIDAPMLVAAGAVQLTGEASVDSLSGLVTGSGTKFLAEVTAGSWVKFGTDLILRKVDAISTDRSMTVTPAPDASISFGPVYRYGYALTQARSRLKELSGALTQVGATLTATGLSMTALAGVAPTTALSLCMSETRDARDTAVSIGLDGTSAGNHIYSAQADVTYGMSTFVTAPVQIGVGANDSVMYAPKKAGVTVSHVVGLTYGVVVTGGVSITVTLGTLSPSAATIAALINSDATAKTLVFAAATGTGADAAVTGTVQVAPFMPPETKQHLDDWLQLAKAKTEAITLAAGNLTAALGTMVDTIGTASQLAITVGRNITEGQLAVLSGLRAQMATVVGTTTNFDSVVANGTLVTDLVSIEGAVTSNELTISNALTTIYNHVDRMLSLDCKANLVSVPILARDKAGFFAAPSNGLIRALQNYLDARKEVTQTVQVTSGANSLVSAVIRVRVGVDPNFSESVTKAVVESAIDGVLRDRRFGVSLYLRELNQAVNGLSGVVFSNIQISGPVDKLDTGVDPANPSDGNLIITTGEVITKGQVTVTTETVAGA